MLKKNSVPELPSTHDVNAKMEAMSPTPYENSHQPEGMRMDEENAESSSAIGCSAIVSSGNQESALEGWETPPQV